MCQKCQQIANEIQSWLDKQGHERCWYYPDIFIRIAIILGIKTQVDPKLPPLKEFEYGCKKFQSEEFKIEIEIPDDPKGYSS